MALSPPRTLSDDEFEWDLTAEEEQLLLQLGSAPPPPPLAQPVSVVAKKALDFVPARAEPGHGHHGSSSRAPHAHQPPTLVGTSDEAAYLLSPPGTERYDVVYPDLSRALYNVEARQPASEATGPVAHPAVASSEPQKDERTPLQRFRSYPKKPFSVSDLTSGAWCELQYWYTLTKLPGGKRTRTVAMKQGSKMHQKLEDEVHTTVEIQIMTKEDGFGLRLWNYIQGLRTLRETGLTRELEVWGMVDGNLVNGVIDSLSYQHPNPKFEEELSSQESSQEQAQPSIYDYFPPAKSKIQSHPKIYLTDVKTRGTLTRVSPALLRPAKVQLLLYHRFLSDMADQALGWTSVCDRYGLDMEKSFSDGFLAQMGSLHDEIFVDAPSDLDEVSNPSRGLSLQQQAQAETASVDESIVKYRNLRDLLSLVDRETKLAFPKRARSLGHMLRVQYIYRQDGRELDVHDFPVSRQALETYLGDYMAWWRGERKAKGVEIEEAFKCRSCEFAPDCEWRVHMESEHLRKNAERKARASAVRSR